MSEALSRLLVVGGGPRAAGVLERIAANADLLEGASLAIDVVDPHMPGAGRIWRYAQSPLLLMNSRAEDVTMFTDDSVTCSGPARPGPSLAEWAERVRAGEIRVPTASEPLRAEIAALTGASFPSRRLQSLYLEWFFDSTVRSLPPGISVTVHRTSVDHVRRHGRVPGDGHGHGHGHGYRAVLADGSELESDLVLLSPGHTDAQPDDRGTQFARFARTNGAFYAAPAQTQDVDYAPLGPGQDVIVSGMGLAFIDLMAMLTEGRGGTFEADPRPGDPDRLRYRPSGTEPHLWAGSRRGVPYHAKIASTLRGESAAGLRFVTDEAFAALPESISFRRDVLPLIVAECEYAVYREILTGHPEWAGMAWEAFRDEFVAAVEGGRDRADLIARAVPDPALRVDLARLNAPFAGHLFSSRDEVQHALVAYIEHDLAVRTSRDHSETQALFLALLRITFELSRLVPVERLDAPSRREFPGRWHSFFSLVDSGPPPHRLHQVLALHRAGIVSFLGPGLHVSADETTGRFVATSSHSPDRVEARAFIEAFLPPQRLAGSANSLLAELSSREGLGREQRIATESGSESTGRLEVTPDRRLVAPDGTAFSTAWAIGPATSEIALGAFARPRTDAAPFRRNDALARDLLVQARAVARPERRSSDHGHRGPVGPEVPSAPTVAALTAVTSGSAFTRPRVGVIGAGRVGTALARLAVRSGLTVQLCGRGDVARVAESVAESAPGARIGTVEEVAGTSDVVVLAVPLSALAELDPALFAGRIVIDVTNPWGDRDASLLDSARTRIAAARARDRDSPAGGHLTVSELVALRLRDARVVKTLNHISYHDLEDDARPPGAADRRALAVAGDDADAVAAVTDLLDRLGYDAVAGESLRTGAGFEPGAPLFMGRHRRDDLAGVLASVASEVA